MTGFVVQGHKWEWSILSCSCIPWEYYDGYYAENALEHSGIVCLTHWHMCAVVRLGSGCRWCEIWGTAWSWRRCRSGSITCCRSSSSSRHTRCSWMTSAPNATSYARSWWASLVDLFTTIWRLYFNLNQFICKNIFHLHYICIYAFGHFIQSCIQGVHYLSSCIPSWPRVLLCFLSNKNIG